MNLKSQIHRISCFPYRHEGRSQEILLALCSFLLLSQKVSPSLLSHIRRYTGVQERSLDFARDDVTEVALSKHNRCTLREITPSSHRHFERSEKSFSSPFSTTPSLSRLREAPSPPFLRYGVSHFSLPNTLPLTANEKDPSALLPMTIRGISPSTQKKPRQEPELFCVRKTYLPNCASMVPAATAVPITPATFGPIACISR